MNFGEFSLHLAIDEQIKDYIKDDSLFYQVQLGNLYNIVYQSNIVGILEYEEATTHVVIEYFEVFEKRRGTGRAFIDELKKQYTMIQVVPHDKETELFWRSNGFASVCKGDPILYYKQER